MVNNSLKEKKKKKKKLPTTTLELTFNPGAEITIIFEKLDKTLH